MQRRLNSATIVLTTTLCLGLFAACVTTTPDTEDAATPSVDTLKLYNEGMSEYSKGNLKLAEEKLSIVVRRIPQDGQTWFRLANIYAQTNRPRLAVVAYQNALIRNPDNTKAWHNMGVVRLRQAANDFLSLAKSVPPNDPLYERGIEMAQSILELLGELPEVDLRTTVEKERSETPTNSGQEPALNIESPQTAQPDG